MRCFKHVKMCLLLFTYFIIWSYVSQLTTAAGSSSYEKRSFFLLMQQWSRENEAYSESDQSMKPKFVLPVPKGKLNELTVRAGDYYTPLPWIKLRYLTEPNLEPVQHCKMIMLIISTAHEYFVREKLREKFHDKQIWWNPYVRFVFVLGIPAETEINTRDENESTGSTMKRILNESSQYGDILLGNHIDDYFNLTYKTVFGFNWVLQNRHKLSCDYVVKIDSDVDVHISSLLGYLQTKVHPSSTTISCTNHFIEKHLPKKGKWQVYENEFPKRRRYPPSCRGPLYTMTFSAAEALIGASKFIPYFRIEDIYFTGILRTAIQGIKVVYFEFVKVAGTISVQDTDRARFVSHYRPNE